MRIPSLFATLAIAGAAMAQQLPIPAFGSTFTATLTRGFWFQAPVPFVIADLRVPDESSQGFQVVEVIDFGATPPPAFPGTATGTQLFYSNNQPSNVTIPCGVLIPAGNYIGILGACTSSVGSATSANSYAATGGTFASSILGNPVTLTRLGTQFGIGAGGNQTCFSEPAGTISRVEVNIAGAAGFATAINYGTGCISTPDASSYELFSAGAFDLGNSSMTLIRSAGGYLALPGITPYLPPSPAAQVLTLGDDTETSVALSAAMPVTSTLSTSSLTVCSNGYISTATGNGTGFTPTSATFLNAPNMWWSLGWHDLNPGAAGSGQVKFEEVGGVAYVTWEGVFDFAGPTPNTMQAQFELATGIVHFHWQAMSTAGNGWLVGVSNAGPSADPGSIDISTLLPATFTAASFASSGLTQTASARPVLGTTINLVTSNAPPTGVLGISILGLTEFTTGFDLTSLGMPTCNLYTSLDATNGIPLVGGSGSLALPIPIASSFAGIVLRSQGAVFAPGINPFGFVTSNGVRLTLDIN